MIRVTLGLLLTLFLVPAFARDNGQYADVAPEIRKWFDGLTDSKGSGCCSTADGLRLKTDALDPEWECLVKKCRVKISGEWYDVPDDALLQVPNRVGYAVVWYVFENGKLVVRCFLRGTET